MAHDEHPEVIKHKMEETRSSLAEKLETLGSQVSSTVEKTTEAVSETVEAVKDAVGGTAEAVSDTVESVKSAFDFSGHFERNPWLMLGGAVAVGYVAGRWLIPAQPSAPASSWMPSFSQPAAHHGHGNGYPKAEAQPEARETSYRQESGTGGKEDEGWFGIFGEQIGKLQSLAVGVALGLFRDTITRSVAPALGGPVTDWINELTTKLGGKPLGQLGQLFQNQSGGQQGTQQGGQQSAQQGGQQGARGGQQAERQGGGQQGSQARSGGSQESGNRPESSKQSGGSQGSRNTGKAHRR